MKLNITARETVLTPELKKYTTNKMNKLCKAYKQIIEIDVVLEDSTKNNDKKLATAKSQIKVAGPDIVAQAEGKSLFAAVDELERKLIRLLEKNKAVHNPKSSRVARSKSLIKKLFRRFGQE